MSTLDDQFQQYFDSLDRAGDDRCFLCRRTPKEVKAFFGFAEDGTPLDAAQYGIEDVVLYKLDIMSYTGLRPVCAICQLNFDTIFAADGHEVLRALLAQMEHEREKLWPGPRGDRGADGVEEDAADEDDSPTDA